MQGNNNKKIIAGKSYVAYLSPWPLLGRWGRERGWGKGVSGKAVNREESVFLRSKDV